MKTMKRLMSAVLLVTLLASMVVPATFADNAGQDVITYDFQLYENADFASGYTYNGGPQTNFNGHRTYNGTISIAQWFKNNYPAAVNWAMDYANGKNASNADKDFEFRGKNDQGMRMSAVEAGQYVSLRIYVPAAGKYTVDLTAGNVGNTFDVYVFQAAADYAAARTDAAQITAAMTGANCLADNLTLAGEGSATLGQWTFDAAGDYVVVFKAEAANANGISLRTMTLTKAGDVQPEGTTAPETSADTTAPAASNTQIYDFELYNNPDVIAAATKNPIVGVNTNLYSLKYNADGDRMYTWFYGGSGNPDAFGSGIINWRPEASNGNYDAADDKIGNEMKNFATQGKSGNGMQLMLVNEDLGLYAGQLAAIRFRVPEAGEYAVKLTAGTVTSRANVYIFPATTTGSSVNSRMTDLQADAANKISTYVTAANMVGSVTLTADQTVKVGSYNFADAGEYIGVFQIPEGSTKDIYLDNMQLIPADEDVEETTAPDGTTVPEETTLPEDTTPAGPAGSVDFLFDVVNLYPAQCGDMDKKYLDKQVSKLNELYPDTLNWKYEDSTIGTEKIRIQGGEGLRFYGAAGQWAAIRLHGINPGTYDITVYNTNGGNTVNLYLVEEGADIASSLTPENCIEPNQLGADNGERIAAGVEMSGKDYFLVIEQVALDKNDYWRLHTLKFTLADGQPEADADTAPEQTEPTEPTEPFVPTVDKNGIFDFNLITTLPELCGRWNSRHYDKKAVDGNGDAFVDENGKELKIKKYLEKLYEQEYVDWVLEEISSKSEAPLETVEFRSAQGLRIFGAAGDYAAFRLKVPAADTYNLLLTSGGSNQMNIYLAEATENMDIAAAMTEENLLVKDVKAASKAAIAQEVKLEAREYILIVKHTTGDGASYWTLAQLALEKWTPKQAKPAVDKKVYDFDLVSMDGQFVKKTLTNRYIEDGIRVSAKIVEMYAADQLQWIYEGASETFPVKEFSFREGAFRLKASANMKKLSDPWIAFRLDTPGSGKYDVRLVSGDKSQVCVNIYLIPASSTLTLTNEQIKAGMTKENLLVENARIDGADTFYLGDYTFGVEDEYVMVLDFIKGGAMFLSRIEMTRDGLVADGSVKHGTVYSGVVYDLDQADQMDGEYSKSTIYMPDVIDDLNARWASGELNWKFWGGSEGLSGVTVKTAGQPTDSLRFYRATGMRVYGAPDGWIALKIKSPGSGDYTVSINHATCANSGTMAMYVLPADTEYDKLWEATDPENRVGKVTLTNDTGVSAVVDGETAIVGSWNFEAGKEYILILECYEASIYNSKRCYMNISQIIMQKGITEKSEEETEKTVTAMTVAKEALPIADAGTYGALMDVDGHTYYFLPVEGKYMLIYDLDSKVLIDKVYTYTSKPNAVVVTKDNKIVLGATARPFVYDPFTGEGYRLSDLRETPGLEDTQQVFSMCVDEDNKLWFGINYGGFIASYDFTTKEYTNYGNPWGWQNRVSAVIRRGDYLYGGIHGDNLNKIFRFNIVTRQVEAEYDISDIMGTASYIHTLNFLGDDYLIAGGSKLTGSIVLDPMTFEPVDLGLFAIPNLGVSEEIDGKQYLVQQKYGLYEYDIATKTVSKVPGFGTEGIGFKTGGMNSYGKTLIEYEGDPCLFTYTSDGGHPRLYNLNTKEYFGWDNLVVDGGGGAPLRTFLSWGEGSNRFSFGGFNTDNCAVFNTELGKVEFYYKTGGQTDSHIWYEGKLYAGNYSSTTLNEIYPDETNTSLPTTNELIQRWRLDHAETGQKRIHIMEAGDGYVFAGTTPDSNLNGGGIVTYDTSNGRWKFKRNVVQDQSVNGLEYHDGLLYGSTTVTGGSGAAYVEGTSAVIFVYDYKTEETVAVMDPRDYIEGLAGPVAHIDGVTADPNVEENGRFWSIVSEVLFCFTYDKEAKTFNVQEVISFYKGGYADGGTNNWWPKSVLFDTEKNYMYVSFQTNGGMQRLEIEDWNAPIGEVKVKSNERFMADIPVSNFMLIGDDGNFYYAVDTDVKMFPLNLTDEDWAIAQQVDDLILAIGDEITVDSEAAIRTARSAYENLSWRYKSLIQKLEVLQEAESDILERKVDALEGVTMTADDFPRMSDLMQEYKGLNARQQRYVKNYSLLKEKYDEASALNDQRVAAALQKKIDALKDKFPLTLDNEQEVLDIRAEYKTLTGKQSLLVDTTVLEDAEAQIKELRSEFVKYVETLIQAIPDEITLSAEEAVTAAREAADKLYTGERKEVSYSKLTSAEGKLRTLKNAKAKAEEVDALIKEIGIVTLGDKDRIAEAREAYDALNGTALTFVQNGKKLERAEWILKALQTWGIPAIVAVVAGAGFCVTWFVPSLHKKVFKTKKKEEETEVIDN